MKILVFSDSHNHAYRIENALLSETTADLIIHLGDCISDIQSIRAKYPKFKYAFVPVTGKLFSLLTGKLNSLLFH